MSKKKHAGKRQTFAELRPVVPSSIPAPEAPGDSALVFSFKYLDFSNDKFSINDAELKYTVTLLDRLKQYCCLTVKEFVQPGGNPKAIRSHKIEWEGTSEKKGFGILNEVWKGNERQFQLSSNEYGRVHGFLLGNTFYIVWLDPQHQLYPEK